MRHQHDSARRRLAILVAAIGGEAAATDDTSPRTAWGAPDLQGTWTNASLTSLERDAMFKAKPFLMSAEADEYERTNAFAQS